jgi:hypothetical protein
LAAQGEEGGGRARREIDSGIAFLFEIERLLGMEAEEECIKDALSADSGRKTKSKRENKLPEIVNLVVC